MELTYEQNKTAVNVKCHKELPRFTKILCWLFEGSFNTVCYKVISRQYERGFLTSVQLHESLDIKNTIISGKSSLSK